MLHAGQFSVRTEKYWIMKRYYAFCAAVGFLPFLVLIICFGGLYFLGCESVGADSVRCAGTTEKVGKALTGFAYVGAFGWLVSIPFALLLAAAGFLIKRMFRDENA